MQEDEMNGIRSTSYFSLAVALGWGSLIGLASIAIRKYYFSIFSEGVSFEDLHPMTAVVVNVHSIGLFLISLILSGLSWLLFGKDKKSAAFGLLIAFILTSLYLYGLYFVLEMPLEIPSDTLNGP